MPVLDGIQATRRITSDHQLGGEDEVDEVVSVGCFTDHLEIGLCVQQRGEPRPHDRLVVGHHDPDRHLQVGRCRQPGIGRHGRGSIGTRAVTWNPFPELGPATRTPPRASTRSAMLARP